MTRLFARTCFVAASKTLTTPAVAVVGSNDGPLWVSQPSSLIIAD